MAVDDGKCFSCSGSLAPVFDNALATKFGQYTNALTVAFSGGYGMYFDHLGKEIFEILVCKSCIEDVRTKIPWIDHALHIAESDPAFDDNQVNYADLANDLKPEKEGDEIYIV